MDCLACLVQQVHSAWYRTNMTVVCAHCTQTVCATHSIYRRCFRTMNVKFHCMECGDECTDSWKERNTNCAA